MAVKELVNIAKDANLTPSQIALGWCLRRNEITSVIVGARNVSQIEASTKVTLLPRSVLNAVEGIAKSAPSVSAVDPL